jgi:hypothetical protein
MPKQMTVFMPAILILLPTAVFLKARSPPDRFIRNSNREVRGDIARAPLRSAESDRATEVRILRRRSVPNYKMKWDSGNPTGHGIIFIGSDASVLCYVPPGGV